MSIQRFQQTLEVELVITLRRPGWQSPDVWGEVETDHELRAEVTLYGNIRSLACPEPDVSWLDHGAVEELQLTRAEEKAAERQAIGAAIDKLAARDREETEVSQAIDAELARWKEEREMARAG